MIKSEDAKKGKNTRIYWDEKTKTKQQTNLTIQLEEINKEYWRKKRNLKDTETGSRNATKTGLSKITKENYTNWKMNEDIPTNGCKGSKKILE